MTDDLVLRMTTGYRSSASNARGMGMKKKSKDQGHLIVVNESGAQRTGSGDSVDGRHCRFMLQGYSQPRCAPYESLSGRREKIGEGVRSTR